MKILIYFLFLSHSYLSFAQVNIEKYSNLKLKTGFNSNMSLYLSAKTGNTDVQEFGIDGRLNYQGNGFFSFLIGQGEYGWENGKEYSNNALLHFRYIHELSAILNPEFFTQINYNKSRLLSFRWLGGGGIRFEFITDSLTQFDIGTSYMYELENLDLTKSSIHPKNTYHHRWSNYVSYSSIIAKNSRLSVVVYLQPRIRDFSDLRILSENHFSVALTNKLSLSIKFSLRHDSDPPDGVKDLDTNTKLGLSIKL